MKKIYVVMKMNSWDSLKTQQGFNAVTIEGQSCGFICVYANREHAEQEWPGCDVLEMEAGKSGTE